MVPATQVNLLTKAFLVGSDRCQSAHLLYHSKLGPETKDIRRPEAKRSKKNMMEFLPLLLNICDSEPQQVMYHSSSPCGGWVVAVARSHW